MTTALPDIERRIWALVMSGTVLLIMNSAVVPEGWLRVFVSLCSAALDVGALVLMFKANWLGLGAFLERRRR